MRKEVLFAVIFGIILGGIILFGINLANNSVKSNVPAVQTTPTPISVSNTPTPTIKKLFEVLTPLDHSVITENTTTVRGVAEIGSSVAIISELNDLIVEVSPEGTFSAQINLDPGANNIKVIQANKDKKTDTISISVIQSTNIPE